MNTPAPLVPDRVAVRMHNVGFGDCFLLSFTYGQPLEDGRDERHVLIDFGSTSLPTGRDLTTVAQEIRTRTSGALDVVVLTHRHRDHLSAFGTKAIADLLTSGQPPSLVVRPWSEDPAADANFKGAAGGPGDRSLGFLRSMRDAHGFATAISEDITAAKGRGLSADLHQMAMTQLANADAVAQLDAWADGSGEYLCYGMASRIEQVVPGLGVRVLGPPTIEQHPEVAGQREVDAEEFWMLYRGLAESVPRETYERLGSRRAEPAAAEGDHGTGSLGPTRWITDRLDHQQLASFLRIVRTMDDQLNNTSLILLLSVEGQGGMKRMLFGGDAQIENWDVHRRPMAALVSTKTGVHGDSPETAVPRETLVEALRERTKGALYSSKRDIDATWIEVATAISSSDPFTPTAQG
jgi:hypothetical protein